MNRTQVLVSLLSGFVSSLVAIGVYVLLTKYKNRRLGHEMTTRLRTPGPHCPGCCDDMCCEGCPLTEEQHCKAPVPPKLQPPPIEITGSNRKFCEDARDTLKLNFTELVAMTKKYPVVCEFATFRRVFQSEEDILKTLNHLEEQLKEYACPTVPVGNPCTTPIPETRTGWKRWFFKMERPSK